MADKVLDGSVEVTGTVLPADAFDPIIKEVADLADKSGVDVCLVGGAVRDYFLDRTTTDYDFTVLGDSIAFAEQLGEKLNSKVVAYERFRTAMVPVGGFNLEFVGTRKEEYDGKTRNPKVSEGTLYDDIARRDFTVNSLAIQIGREYRLIDVFGGMADMQAKLLRTPLDPHTTYADDPLRMIRAARFASQLGFEIEEKSYSSISSLASNIKKIKQERITAEFLKILQSPKPSIGLGILFKTGIMEYIFPELHKLAGIDIVEQKGRRHGHKDVFWHTLQVVDNISPETDNVWLIFAALMHDVAKPQTKRFDRKSGWTFHGHEELGARMQKRIFRSLKLPMDHLPYVETLVRLHQRPMQLVDSGVTDSAIRRLAATAGEALEDLFTLCRADITTRNRSKESRYLQNYTDVFDKVVEVQQKDELRAFQSPVRGDEIMKELGLPPGRIIGFIKNNIEEAILEGIIPNEYGPANKYFIENKEKWIAEWEDKSS
jgi:tRNA nucleotidyltransferase/poly(A) polymerase